MPNATTFQRRKHERYAMATECTVEKIGSDGGAAQFQGCVLNISRYGVEFESIGEISSVNPSGKLRLALPNSRCVTLGIRVLRRSPNPSRGTRYAAELSFHAESERRKLHAFLRSPHPKQILERRGSERRRNATVYNPESRKRDRRRDFGIFSEAVSFASRADRWKTVYTFFRQTEASGPARITVNGRELVSFGSKDYLGLSHDPRVKAAAVRALERYGTGSGSPVLNGTLGVHEELEQELASFKKAEAAIFFAGGYLANTAILTGLLRRGDVVFLDERAHASTFDGALFGGATVVRFMHNSVADLQRKIKTSRRERNLLIVDGVYSVEGDLGQLPELQEVAKTYNVPLMVDDAHGLGVMGPTGAGTSEHFGLLGKIDIEVGTASAALGGVGGFLAGKKEVVQYLRHFSRGFLFTTSLPAATAAGLLEALRIVRADPLVREKLWNNIIHLKTALIDLGYKLGSMQAAVVCIPVGDEMTTYSVVQMLEERGIYVNAFVRPAVRRGSSIIRLSISAAHSQEDIQRTIEAFQEIRPVFR